MTLSKQEVQAMYQSGAKQYDRFVQLYRLIGFRIDVYRSRAVELLHLKRGDSVVELGCGTGLNFPLIIEQIGSEGRLVGIDLTPNMLACARERVERSGWKNVELVQVDIGAYDFPKGINAVLSTGVFGFVAEYNRVIRNASQALVPGSRLVIMDGKYPERWPVWIFRLFVRFGRPFGLIRDYFARHPWESVKRYFQETAMDQMYGGVLYISSGITPSPTV